MNKSNIIAVERLPDGTTVQIMPDGSKIPMQGKTDAEDVLLDQAFFTVDENTFAKFQVLLDQPLPPTDKLRRLLKTKAPWETCVMQ